MNKIKKLNSAAPQDIYFTMKECFLGCILVALNKKGICAIFFADAPNLLLMHLKAQFPFGNLIAGDKKADDYAEKIIRLMEKPTLKLDLPLDIQGTAFQQRVWKAIAQIPRGETISYTNLAKKIGAPTAVRAVASACGANNLAFVIPCHRVVGQDGSLSGYRFGIERKRLLLNQEAH